MVTMGVFPFQGKNARGRAGNRTRDLVVSQELWPPSHEAGLFLICLRGENDGCVEKFVAGILRISANFFDICLWIHAAVAWLTFVHDAGCWGFFYSFEKRKWRLCRDICSWHFEDDFGELVDLREHILRIICRLICSGESTWLSYLFWWKHVTTMSDCPTPHKVLSVFQCEMPLVVCGMFGVKRPQRFWVFVHTES